MNLEVLSATNFIVNLLRRGREDVRDDELGIFRKSLMEVIRQRVSLHWYPDQPLRGSGYRCIRVNSRMDAVIEKAARMSGMSEEMLRQGLPGELAVWVDPGEVGYRFGENHGSYCVLWKKGEGEDDEPWTSSNQNVRNDLYRQSPVPSSNSRQSPVDLNSSRVVHNVDNSQYLHRSGHVVCSIGYNVRNYQPTMSEHPIIWLPSLTSMPPPPCLNTTSQVEQQSWNMMENPCNIDSRQSSPARHKPWMSYKNMDFWTRDMGLQNQLNGRQYA